MSVTGDRIPDQYSKIIGNSSRYPYLVGISTESGDLGTGILISARFVLTCGHVLHDSLSAEVISQEGSTSARVLKVDDFLDLALLELTRPISAPKAKFTNAPLQPGALLLAVGVQQTPGKSDELSIAEIQMTYRNKNDADGKILDIQLEGGARPGYSGGPVVIQEGGALRCVGLIRFGGHGASSSNAIGLASIRAFVTDYIPDMQEDKNVDGTRRLLILTAIFFGVFIVGAIADWFYMASHNSTTTSGTTSLARPEPEKPAVAQSIPGTNTPTHSVKLPSAQTPAEAIAGLDRVAQGNPNARVWVNTASNVYHCPGARSYGKTIHGEYMSQSEAQKRANRPAYGKVCK